MPLLILLAFLLAAPSFAQPEGSPRRVPRRVPPKRTAQIQDGFGINTDLPREPYLPWERWWWTRMFDAGVKWVRIGQYENSSDPTSWDWVERKRGVLAIPPGLDDYVDSLVDNGARVQVQLQYGNPMYTAPAGKLPDAITPAPGSFHNDDRSLYSIFYPPKTPEQIAAFLRYVRFMVGHFKGRIRYWALWNEPDIGYFNGTAEDYGRILKAFVPAVHEADPEAKVIYGGQEKPHSDWTKRALDACGGCARGIDVFAYHTYPNYGFNTEPELIDRGVYDADTTANWREFVRGYPGVRQDVEFWDDEFNSIAAWVGSDDSVQSKYVVRGMLYNWAAGVKTFVWILAPGTDGNEYDDFGMLHGLRYLPDDFAPRPVFGALQNVNALFSDTRPDPSIGIESDAVGRSTAPFFAHGFRSRSGKAIVAFWFGAHSLPGNVFPDLRGELALRDSGIERPVLIDVVSGEITPLEWKAGAPGTLASVPLRDSVLAVADESFFDWAELPEAPSGLKAKASGKEVRLSWELHGGGATEVALERRAGGGAWEPVGKVPASVASHSDIPPAVPVAYRVFARNAAGASAYSNLAKPAP